MRGSAVGGTKAANPWRDNRPQSCRAKWRQRQFRLRRFGTGEHIRPIALCSLVQCGGNVSVFISRGALNLDRQRDHARLRSIRTGAIRDNSTKATPARTRECKAFFWQSELS